MKTEIRSASFKGDIMDMQKLVSFLMWCTIINGVLLVLGTAAGLCAPDLGLRLQAEWFRIPRETLHAHIYLILGLYKLLWLFFNVAPYAALKIVTR
jgi:hypothetical protein